MTLRAYYNENDPGAVRWLRALVAEGLIAPGDVDDRDVRLVRAGDLAGYGQCHFFAGVGGWSLALRLAGVPDHAPIWTGSCPCQPYSSAGKRKGDADDRNLWPYFKRLIAQRQPTVVFGEQVASAAGRLWLARVRTDLEKLGHAVGAADLCAAGVGAPHIRQRLFWLAQSNGRQLDGFASWQRGVGYGAAFRRAQSHGQPQRGRAPGGLADNGGHGRKQGTSDVRAGQPEFAIGRQAGAGAAFAYWDSAGWIACDDGKYRRAEPGIFPLADGRAFRHRVAELRGAGNLINIGIAAEFIGAGLEAAR